MKEALVEESIKVKRGWWRSNEREKWSSLGSQGKGVKLLSQQPCNNTWSRGHTFLKEGEYIDALKMRANVYPTREAMSRAHGTSPMCRRCGRFPETLGHISGYCYSVKDARIQRHNRVLDEVIRILKKAWF